MFRDIRPLLHASMSLKQTNPTHWWIYKRFYFVPFASFFDPTNSYFPFVLCRSIFNGTPSINVPNNYFTLSNLSSNFYRIPPQTGEIIYEARNKIILFSPSTLIYIQKLWKKVKYNKKLKSYFIMILQPLKKWIQSTKFILELKLN